MPVDAQSRPLLDERRAGGFGCLPGRASLAIDRAASDGACMHCSRARRLEPSSTLMYAHDPGHPEPPNGHVPVRQNKAGVLHHWLSHPGLRFR